MITVENVIWGYLIGLMVANCALLFKCRWLEYIKQDIHSKFGQFKFQNSNFEKRLITPDILTFFIWGGISSDIRSEI